MRSRAQESEHTSTKIIKKAPSPPDSSTSVPSRFHAGMLGVNIVI